jgi:protein SCO1/2
MNRRAFFLTGAAAAVAPLALPSRSEAARPLSQRGGAAYFTNAELRTHDGRTMRFYDDLVRGKIVLINFMYTDCGDICPGMTQNLADLQKLLGDRVGRDIFMYSISMQPEQDTPERLKAYAETFDVKPGWLFLTGAPADVDLLRRRLGFADSNPVQDADLEQHIGILRIGNEPLNRWVMAAALSRPAALMQNIRLVTPGGAAPRASQL